MIDRLYSMRPAAFACLAIFFLFSTATAQKPDRSKPPELGPPPSLSLPTIQRASLSNGIPVLLMEKHGVPVLELRVQVMSGTVSDPAGRRGLAGMTAEMMMEGAGTRNSLELADAIDFLGASLAVEAGLHTSVITLHTPLARLDPALEILSDVAAKPTFPERELDRLRKENLTAILQWHDEPDAIASVLFDKTLYGKKHPYGTPSIGSPASLKSLTVDDLKDFHGAHYHAGNSSVIVAGDITMKQLLPKLESALGSWRSGSTTKENVRETAQIAGRRIYLVDKSEAAQSEIRIGRIGVERKTDDYYALVVMNTILGGSFSSRLNQNLRETHGYTYGAGSYFSFRPFPGPFLSYSAVQTDVTDKALDEFFSELNRILEPVTDEELVRARNYVALGYPENFQTVSGIAGRLARLNYYGLPDDFFNTFVQRILAVTKDDVLRVSKKYIDPEAVAVIVVGDRSKIEEGIRALNLGPVEVLSIEDVLGPPPVIDN